MTVESILNQLDEQYNATAVKDLARYLRDEDEYDLRISLSKTELIEELEEVSKRDLLEAIDEVLPDFWDEDSEDGKESDDDSSDDESDDEGDEDE